MSLFGKVLALFNIFGAIALVCFAAMDYGKRGSFAYATFRHERVVHGLPLDDAERDTRGAVIAAQLGPSARTEMFQQAGGSPAVSQLEEVNRFKQALTAKVDQAAGHDPQAALLARILLPLTDTFLERDQLLACRFWLATKEDAARLRARYLAAFDAALKAPLPEEKSFENDFRVALRNLPIRPEEPGQPTDALTTLVLRKLATPPKRDGFEKAFDAALTEQRDQLRTRFDQHFNEVLTGTVGVKKMSLDAQKAAVARLLFGLAIFQVEEEFKRTPTESSADYARRLAGSNEFRTALRRVFVVCGLKNGLAAITERTTALRQMAQALRGVMTREQMEFVADNALLVEQVREAAYLVHIELAKKAESERRLAVQKAQVAKQKAGVEALTEELSASQEQTKAKLKKLRALSQELLDERVKARDLIRQTEDAERTIRELEHRVREMEKADK